jgi:fatty-acyl-CoA synthase
MTKPQTASTAYAYPLLIKHLLTSSMLTAPNQEIVSGDLCRYTYREFHKRIGQLANGLAKMGVGRGDTVAVMNWDCHRYLECFFAVPMMGAILHTINIRLSPEQILYTINHAEDDVILVHSDFVPIIEQIRDRIEKPTKLVLISDEEGGRTLPEDFSAEYESVLSTPGSGFEFVDFDEATIATTFYTTGTTGEPKGVFYSHRQLVLHSMGSVAALAPVADEIRLHRRDVYMPMTPMFHVHGWGMPYVATMLGLKQVYPGRYEPARLVRYIEEEKATFSHCVPTIMHMLLSAPEAADADLSGLKVIIGGSALPRGLSQMALDKGIQLFTAYGMSETCPFVTVSDTMDIDHTSKDDHDLAYREKTGKPGVMVDLRVVDENMNDIPRDGKSTGEIAIRTPWLTQGYTGNAEGSEELWRGGYLHTGDVGYIDDTGSLHITDRMKDVIKSGGEWISSLELENIVSGCAGVGEVAAIGIADERWGERPLLVVSRSADGADISASDIIAAVRDHVDSGALPKWAVPERVEFVEAIDKTSVGKLDKKVLRARYS